MQSQQKNMFYNFLFISAFIQKTLITFSQAQSILYNNLEKTEMLCHPSVSFL